MHQPPRPARLSPDTGHPLKIGLFGANCSSGRAVTMIDERWSGSWADCLSLAKAADDAGLDFLLPIGRWKGYGGDTNYQGASLETLTWASALLAATRQITVFGTVHAPLFNPLIAAKQAVTADQVGEGRFGLNIVCGWNEGEFEMFGVTQRDHAERYRYAQEWIDVVKRAWSTDEDWDYEGEFFKHKGVRMRPGPFGKTRPLTMNAGASAEGRAFALRNCDAFFTTVTLADPAATAEGVRAIKQEAISYGTPIGVYTVGMVTCRRTRQEAQEYYRYATEERVDWRAIEEILAMRDIYPETNGPEFYNARRRALASGMGGLPIVGDADDVANVLSDLNQAGLNGIGISFINFGLELPFFAEEVMPRLERKGARQRLTAALEHM